MVKLFRFVGPCLALLPLCACDEPGPATHPAPACAVAAETQPTPAKQDGKPDPLADRRKSWQGTLEQTTFKFDERRAGVLYSLSRCDLDCQVHVVYDPKDPAGLTFEFVRDGKKVLSVPGHSESEFRALKGVLYFAHFSGTSSGCSVAAYDLATGRELWNTRLSAAGCVIHTFYSNHVSLSLGDQEEPGVVCVTGREAFGDYIEVLDRETGQVLAHKRYRTDYARPK